MDMSITLQHKIAIGLLDEEHFKVSVSLALASSTSTSCSIHIVFGHCILYIQFTIIIYI